MKKRLFGSGLVSNLFFLLATIGLCSCVHALSDSARRPAQVTLIFNNAPPLSDTIFMNERVRYLMGPAISICENLIAKPIKPVAGKIDTIVMTIASSKVKFQHRNNAAHQYETLLYPGDTLDVSYLEADPIFNIRNRNVNAHDLNLDSLLHRSLYAGNGFSSLVFYETYPMIKLLKSKAVVMMMDPEEKNEWEQKALKEMLEELGFIDSLRNAGLISDDVYGMRKDRLVFKPYVMDYTNRRVSDMAMRAVLDSVRSSGVDGANTYFLELAQLFLARQLSAEATLLYDTVEPVAKASGNYARLEGSDVFPARVKELLLYRQVHNAAQHLPLEVFRSTFHKFSSYSADTALINAIKREYTLEFHSLRSEAESVILLSADGKQLTLDQLLKDNAGKVLYVDFWASWCVPCRRAMPASHDLRDLYTGKPIHFIYISIDRKFDDWAKASAEDGLSDSASNFLYLNAGSSKWAKEMKLNTIPRYVVFDKKGALSHRDAPGPDGVGAKELLDKYL